jgi:hypothetical protein
MAYAAPIVAARAGLPWAGVSTSLNPVVPGDWRSELIATTSALPRAELFADYGLRDARFRVSDCLSPYLNVAWTGPELVGEGPADVVLAGASLPLAARGDEGEPLALEAGRPLVFMALGSQIYHQPRMIAVGNIGRLEDQPAIEGAAVRSLADTVAERLTGGYTQMLGRRFEGGVDLSGGEWQKVALARAYMREAQLLILDEPTAALDARAEYEVFLRFSELTKGRMAVLISHRFSTVRMADRIVVLRGGELVEQGTHEELLTIGGLYSELFQLQAAGYR